MQSSISSTAPRADVRICDLRILSPHTTEAFGVDGLYMVLRLGNQVHRTECLGQQTASGDDGLPRYDTDDPLDSDEELDDAFVWDELFRLPLHGSSSLPTVLPRMEGGYSPLDTGELQPAGVGMHTVSGILSSSPDVSYPTIHLELWRSTKISENCLARYSYCVPFESLVPGSRQVGEDSVREKVVAMHVNTTGSLDPVRVGIRVRVRIVGWVPLTSPAAFAAPVRPMRAFNQLGVLSHLTADSGTSGAMADSQLLATLLQQQSAGQSGYHSANMSSVLPLPSSVLDAPPHAMPSLFQQYPRQ